VKNNPVKYTDPSGHCIEILSDAGDGLCLAKAQKGGYRVARGGTVFVNDLEKGLANLYLSGDDDRRLSRVKIDKNESWVVQKATEHVLSILDSDGYSDGNLSEEGAMIATGFLAAVASIDIIETDYVPAIGNNAWNWFKNKWNSLTNSNAKVTDPNEILMPAGEPIGTYYDDPRIRTLGTEAELREVFEE
jgi:hypothetical protein